MSWRWWKRRPNDAATGTLKFMRNAGKTPDDIRRMVGLD